MVNFDSPVLYISRFPQEHSISLRYHDAKNCSSFQVQGFSSGVWKCSKGKQNFFHTLNPRPQKVGIDNDVSGALEGGNISRV